MLKLTILMALFATITLQVNFFNLVKMPTQNGAMCMDGSPFGIYICEPDPDDVPVVANRLLIVWEDFPHGWCFQTDTSGSVESCMEVKGDFSSSKDWGNT